MSHETEIQVVSRSQTEEHCQFTDRALSIHGRSTVNSQKEHCKFTGGALSILKWSPANSQEKLCEFSVRELPETILSSTNLLTDGALFILR